MFKSPGDIISALKRFRDVYDPRTASFMLAGGGGGDPHAEPFRKGFIAHFDERAELTRRLRRLDDRARRLILLWHVEGRPVTHIAKLIGVSRVHCYRLSRRALEEMLDPAVGTERTSVPERLAAPA